MESVETYLETGLDYFERYKNIPAFTSGIKKLDDILLIPGSSKGIRTGETYEFFGSFRSGKTQLCHQLCVTVQLPIEKSGLGKKAIYIDTENTFSPSRIKQMGNRLIKQFEWEIDIDTILKNISRGHAKNSDMQQGILIEVLQLVEKNPNEYGLLIVDSVMAHYRSEYVGRSQLPERQQLLNQHLKLLHRIAVEYNLAVVITNQVVSDPSKLFGDPLTAAGGNIVSHFANTRIMLKKSKGEKRIVRIIDSPAIAELETTIEITMEGVV